MLNTRQVGSDLQKPASPLTRFGQHLSRSWAYLVIIAALSISLGLIITTRQTAPIRTETQTIYLAGQQSLGRINGEVLDGLSLGDSSIDNLAIFKPFQPTNQTTEDQKIYQYIDLPGGSKSRSMAFTLPDGVRTLDTKITLGTSDPEVTSCTSVHTFVDDTTNQSTRTPVDLRPSVSLSLGDGAHNFTTNCNSGGSSISDSLNILVADNLAERCAGHNFTKPERSFAEDITILRSQLVGSWSGCVKTPWLAPYFAEVKFDSNGQYQITSPETLDGIDLAGGIYRYSLANPDQRKTYSLISYQYGLGQGQLDIVSPNGLSVNRADLRNIRLDAGRLSFDIYHRYTFGPIEFELTKL